jgi:hypothetical protein
MPAVLHFHTLLLHLPLPDDCNFHNRPHHKQQPHAHHHVLLQLQCTCCLLLRNPTPCIVLL